MRLHRFYIDSTSLITGKLEMGKNITILEERLIHQWKNVFKYKPGDRIILFNGGGSEYIAEIEDLKKENGKIKIIEKKEGVLPSKKIILYQSLIKKDNVELVVQKATELGVSIIVPIISERSEKKGFNIERARKIAIEASEQCGRTNIPELSPILNLKDCIMNYTGESIAFDYFGESFHNSYFVNHDPISVFIGPEGGWSPNEIERFKEKNIKIFSLGKLTLRAETAAVVALSLLSLE